MGVVGEVGYGLGEAFLCLVPCASEMMCTRLSLIGDCAHTVVLEGSRHLAS